MNATKPVWESKTIIACVSALAGALMAIVGHYAGSDPLPDAALLSAWTSAVASVLGIVFRVNATHLLTISKEKEAESEEKPAPPAEPKPEPEPEPEPETEPEEREESADG